LTKDQKKHQLENDETIKAYIIEVTKTKRPETATELISLTRQKYPLSTGQITSLLLQLKTEDKIGFTEKPVPTPTTTCAYMLSKDASWFWITIALSIVTVIAVFTIPENAGKLTYLRSALGAVFVLFLPGYAFMKALFPSKNQISTRSENVEKMERLALSLGMSLVLTPLVGLILNYTPWGIRLTPVTLSLLAFTVVFAAAAVLREFQTTHNNQETLG
jgi:hypothetical protein